MDFGTSLAVEVLATLTGILIGTLAAFAIDRHRERIQKNRRAQIILRSIQQELKVNFDTLRSVRAAFVSNLWGKSFYIDTSAWDTAVASGDLPDIIGFELADLFSSLYAVLVRIKYYGDLMTKLWFAPPDIPGYKEKQVGFNEVIVNSISEALDRYNRILKLFAPSRKSY